MSILNKFRKLKSLNWQELLPLLQQGKKQSKRSYLDLIIDLKRCYDAGYNWGEYFYFGFQFNRDPEYRRSFVCTNVHYAQMGEHFKTNEKDTWVIDDKGKFNRLFADLKNYEAIDLRIEGRKEMIDFFDRHPTIFAKFPDGVGGHEVRKLKREDYPDAKSLRDLYEELIATEFFVLEEGIVQHPEMSKLSLNAVNTLRVVTIRTPDGRIVSPFVSSRIATDDSTRDNCSIGGASCRLAEDGIVRHAYFADIPRIGFFTENKYNGFKFAGFKLPFFEESLALCRKAMERLEFNFIGWDVAITERGPVLIEANRAASFDLFQPFNQLRNNSGCKAELEQYIGFKLKDIVIK